MRRGLSDGGYCNTLYEWVATQTRGQTVKMKENSGFQKEFAYPKTLRAQSKSFL